MAKRSLLSERAPSILALIQVEDILNIYFEL